MWTRVLYGGGRMSQRERMREFPFYFMVYNDILNWEDMATCKNMYVWMCVCGRPNGGGQKGERMVPFYSRR